MNFLAHLYLAGEEEELIVGNFIADCVKGNKYKDYPERIAQGILMHREIDFFSDTHPIYLESAHRLSAKHGKFSGVIVDMLYDHILASNWKDFSGIPLEVFCSQVYDVLATHQPVMPLRSQGIYHYMSKGNWLLSYKHMSGLERALKGLSSRMKYFHPMNEAVVEIEKDMELYKQEFYRFFPLLVEHVKPFLKHDPL